MSLGGRTDKEQHFMQEAELFNERFGMLAITGFAIQEWFLNRAVVDQISMFLKPINVAFEPLHRLSLQLRINQNLLACIIAYKT